MTEQLPDFDHFDHDDAWRVGSALVARNPRDGPARDPFEEPDDRIPR